MPLGKSFSNFAAFSTEIRHLASFGFPRREVFRVLPPVEDFIMPRTKRGPGATQEDPPSK